MALIDRGHAPKAVSVEHPISKVLESYPNECWPVETEVMASLFETKEATLMISELLLGPVFLFYEEWCTFIVKYHYCPVLWNLRSPTTFFHFVLIFLSPLAQTGSVFASMIPSLRLASIEIAD